MTKISQFQADVPETPDNDPRIGHLLGTGLGDGDSPKVAIIGFPSDEGVRRNNGRPGAEKAPFDIRSQLYKMTPSAEHYDQFVNLIQHTEDVGNVVVNINLETSQKDLGQVLAPLLQNGTIPVIIGGGHETAYGHFLGYAESNLKTAILNVDAHADVRPLKDGEAHSGSPFRQALTDKSLTCEKYMVAGLQSHSVSKEHLEFIENNEGSYIFRDATNITSISGLLHEHDSDRLMVTFDMDAVDQSQAPGVSAPCANGLSSDLWLTSAYLAGRNEKVTSFDVSEVNPEYDRDGQTVRLAALTIWHFLLGVSQRS